MAADRVPESTSWEHRTQIPRCRDSNPVAQPASPVSNAAHMEAESVGGGDAWSRRRRAVANRAPDSSRHDLPSRQGKTAGLQFSDAEVRILHTELGRARLPPQPDRILKCVESCRPSQRVRDAGVRSAHCEPFRVEKRSVRSLPGGPLRTRAARLTGAGSYEGSQGTARALMSAEGFSGS
jgi:hypothetical protein